MIKSVRDKRKEKESTQQGKDENNETSDSNTRENPWANKDSNR